MPKLITLESVGRFDLGDEGVTNCYSNPPTFIGPFAPTRLHANHLNTKTLEVYVNPPSRLGDPRCILFKLFAETLGDGTLRLLHIDPEKLNSGEYSLVDFETLACSACSLNRALEDCTRVASIKLADRN